MALRRNTVKIPGKNNLGRIKNPMLTARDIGFSGAGGYVDGVYRGEDGIFRNVFFGLGDETVYAAYTANQIYDDLAISTPELWYFVANQETNKLGLAKSQPSNQGNLNNNFNERNAALLLRGFAADFLLGNNYNANQVLIGGRGNPIRMNTERAFSSRSSGNNNWNSGLNSLQQRALRTVGANSPSELQGITSQIRNIVDLRRRYGSWDNYLSVRGPRNMSADQRRRIARVLENRTRFLEQQLRRL